MTAPKKFVALLENQPFAEGATPAECVANLLAQCEGYPGYPEVTKGQAFYAVHFPAGEGNTYAHTFHVVEA